MDRDQSQQRAETAAQRSRVYGLLAALYRREVNAELLALLKEPRLAGLLGELGIGWERVLSDQPAEAILEDLATEYARLFLGPGKHISPHESVQRTDGEGGNGQLWGEATVEVKRLIEGVGLRYDEGYNGLPDHISVELEFMEALTRREEEAWAEGDEKTAASCRELQRKFLADHVLRWVPRFCEKVREAATNMFYRDLANMTERFMDFEKEDVLGRSLPN